MLTSWRTKSRSQTTFTFKIRPGKYAWLAWENRLINSQFKPFCTLRSHWSKVPIADESQRTKPNNREGTDHQTLLTRLSSAWMFFLTNKKKKKKHCSREKFPARTNFRPPAPVGGINTGNGAGWRLESISDDTIISYILTLSQRTSPGRTSGGGEEQNKRIDHQNNIYFK